MNKIIKIYGIFLLILKKLELIMNNDILNYSIKIYFR